MGRHARTGDAPTKGNVAVDEPGAVMVDVDAFVGEPKRRINLANPAPFGYGTAITLGLVALVDRADSAMIGGLLPTLQKYFGFGDGMAGILLSAPSLAALLLVIPAGRLADTKSRKMVISIVILIWGLLTFGAAAAPTFAAFFLARVLLGIATPLNIPASASILGDMYRSEARTKAFSVVRVMEYLGFPVGVVIGGVVGQTLGWRPAFLIAGVPAIILSAYVAVKFKEPKRGLADDLTIEAERAGIAVVVAEADPHAGFSTATDPGESINVEHAEEPDLQQSSVWARTKEVLSIRTLRWIIIGQALLFAGFSGLFSFAPTFFYRVQDLPEGAAAGIAGGLGMIGLVVGGVFASRIGDRHHGERKGWRVLVSAVMLCTASVSVLLLAVITILPIQILLYLLINFCNIIALANLGAAQADVIPARMRGTGFATAQFLVTIGSSFGAVIVGTVSGYYIRGKTTITNAQVTHANEDYTDAQDALKKAVKQGDPQNVVDQLQAAVLATKIKFEALDVVFGPIQAIGIRWGVGALFFVLIAGGLTIFKARSSYDEDAAKVIAEAENAAGPDPSAGSGRVPGAR